MASGPGTMPHYGRRGRPAALSGRDGAGRLVDRWTTVGAWRLYARVSAAPAPGGAPPVVLVHGLGVSSRYMVPLARRLAPDYPVYAPDLPGFGRSDKPARALALPALADALAAWLAAAGLERPVLLGNSLGCQVIVQCALRHPGRLARAILVGPTLDPRARTVRQQGWRLLVDAFREAPSEPLIAIRDYWRAGPRRVWATLRGALRVPVEEHLRRVAVPTLVVRGGRDPIVPQRWAEEVARLLPCGRLVVVPGAPHAVNYSAPEALARAIRPFLDEAARHD